MNQKIKRRYRGNLTDIILVPPVLNLLNPDSFENSFYLGIAVLDAVLKRNGIKTKIYSPEHHLFKKTDYIKAARDILSFNPMMVGFSTWCITYPVSILISESLKELNPEIIIVFGGPQASILSRETLERFNSVDYVLTGECDFTLPLLVRSLIEKHNKTELNKIPGLAFRSCENSIILNKKAGLVLNLDSLPFPIYSHINKRQKSLTLDVGRGCPFHCTYCSTNDFFSKRYRTKTTERILSEMISAYNNLGISHFEFSHDMFTLNKPFIREFCIKLIQLQKEHKGEFSWNCSARIDCVSEDLLKLMKEAGCRVIFFGIESGSEKIQISTRKKLDVSKVYKIAEKCRNLGIEIIASFIIGFPDENNEDLEKTVRCITRLSIQGVCTQVSELSLVPGTLLYIEHKDQLKFDGRFSNYSSCICGMEEIKLIIKYPEIFSSFYYLPVSTIDRFSLHLLENTINLLQQFRNTLFLLKNNLEKDIENLNLLSLFLNLLPQLRDHLDKKNPFVTFMVSQIKEYIISKNISELNPYVYEVFTYEAIKALILAKFSRWKMIEPSHKKRSLTNSDKKASFRLTPYWQTFTTFHNLKTILPSENGWKAGDSKIRNGNFHYLIIAVSGDKCRMFRIKKTELLYINELERNKDIKTYRITTDIKSGLEENTIWKKMKKLGVIY